VNQQTTFDVRGMTCNSCVRHVERALQAVPGVENVTIRLSPGQATIIHDPVASESALRLAITEAGYEASLLDAPSENRTKGA